MLCPKSCFLKDWKGDQRTGRAIADTQEGCSSNTGGSAFTGPALSACLDHIEYFDRRTHLVGIELYGLEHAGVWGVAAGILRFVPYLGTRIILLASGIAGLLQFGSLPLALAIALSIPFGVVMGGWWQEIYKTIVLRLSDILHLAPEILPKGARHQETA
jgi:hypothetical protein